MGGPRVRWDEDKADTTKGGQKLERGRFAKMLAAGYTIEVKPSPKRKTSKSTTAKPSAASRPSKA